MNRHPARELLSRVCRVTQFKISRGSEVKEGIKVEMLNIAVRLLANVKNSCVSYRLRPAHHT